MRSKLNLVTLVLAGCSLVKGDATEDSSSSFIDDSERIVDSGRDSEVVIDSDSESSTYEDEVLSGEGHNEHCDAPKSGNGGEREHVSIYFVPVEVAEGFTVSVVEGEGAIELFPHTDAGTVIAYEGKLIFSGTNFAGTLEKECGRTVYTIRDLSDLKSLEDLRDIAEDWDSRRMFGRELVAFTPAFAIGESEDLEVYSNFMVSEDGQKGYGIGLSRGSEVSNLIFDSFVVTEYSGDARPGLQNPSVFKLEGASEESKAMFPEGTEVVLAWADRDHRECITYSSQGEEFVEGNSWTSSEGRVNCLGNLVEIDGVLGQGVSNGLWTDGSVAYAKVVDGESLDSTVTVTMKGSEFQSENPFLFEVSDSLTAQGIYGLLYSAKTN